MIWLCMLLLPLPCMTREYGHSYMLYRPSFSSLRKALISRTLSSSVRKFLQEGRQQSHLKPPLQDRLWSGCTPLLKAHAHLLDLAADPIAQYIWRNCKQCSPGAEIQEPQLPPSTYLRRSFTNSKRFQGQTQRRSWCSLRPPSRALGAHHITNNNIMPLMFQISDGWAYMEREGLLLDTAITN